MSNPTISKISLGRIVDSEDLNSAHLIQKGGLGGQHTAFRDQDFQWLDVAKSGEIARSPEGADLAGSKIRTASHAQYIRSGDIVWMRLAPTGVLTNAAYTEEDFAENHQQMRYTRSIPLSRVAAASAFETFKEPSVRNKLVNLDDLLEKGILVPHNEIWGNITVSTSRHELQSSESTYLNNLLEAAYGTSRPVKSRMASLRNAGVEQVNITTLLPSYVRKHAKDKEGLMKLVSLSGKGAGNVDAAHWMTDDVTYAAIGEKRCAMREHIEKLLALSSSQ